MFFRRTLRHLVCCGSLATGCWLGSASAETPARDVTPAWGSSPTESSPQDKAASRILGRWKDEDHGAIVEVTEKDGVFTGRIVSTPLEGVKPGLPVFRGLRYDPAEGAWTGKVYAPRRKSEYNATWRIEGARLKMKVTFGPLWKTVGWDRVK